jgi:hypothetical protein
MALSLDNEPSNILLGLFSFQDETWIYNGARAETRQMITAPLLPCLDDSQLY